MDRGDFLPPNPWLASGANRKLSYRIRKALRRVWHWLWESGVWIFRIQMIAITAIVIVGMAVATFSTASKRGQPLPDVFADIRLIHSFGINPEDGALYVATDLGLYRVDSEDRAYRVAGSRQVLTGFSVIGPDTFLASGRADLLDALSDKEPRARGYARSTDAGRSWQALSLSGEASFTDFVRAHNAIYAYDGPNGTFNGTFMVSTDDGKTWEQRGQPGELLMRIAVSPMDPDRVFGTTEPTLAPSKVLESRDGGRTWQQNDWPSVQHLSWSQPDRLWAVSVDAVYFSSDGGLTWQTRGTAPGQIDAFEDIDGTLYVGANEGDIFISQDDGLTWQLRYRNPPNPNEE